VTPTVDDFQALARSSPWRWTSLHFAHRSRFPGECEAWVRRPGQQLVRTPDGREHRGSAPLPGRDVDPMYGNYTWVAMLNPVELSHDVEVSDLRVDEIFGRPAWWASVRALPGYDPTCACCALIWSEISDSYEYDVPQRRAYPDHYDIALDVQTGIVVRWVPVGGDPAASWLENDILEVS
jgi:hypothetical protein